MGLESARWHHLRGAYRIGENAGVATVCAWEGWVLMGGPAWTLEFYEEAGREPVLDFLRGLDEFKKQSLAAALANVLAYEGIGVCGSSWGKWVGGVRRASSSSGCAMTRRPYCASAACRSPSNCRRPIPTSCCACSAMPTARR